MQEVEDGIAGLTPRPPPPDRASAQLLKAVADARKVLNTAADR